MCVRLEYKLVDFKQTKLYNHPITGAFIYNSLNECRRKKMIKRKINDFKGLSRRMGFPHPQINKNVMSFHGFL
jgi:hypothetical protein